MVRNIGIAMSLHATRRTKERLETCPLSQECDERVTWRLEEVSITAIVAMHNTRYIIFCVPVLDRCHIGI